jgi:hypothetical protein
MAITAIKATVTNAFMALKEILDLGAGRFCGFEIARFTG